MCLVYGYPTDFFFLLLLEACAVWSLHNVRILSNECEILTTRLNCDVQDIYLFAFLVTHDLEFPNYFKIGRWDGLT